MNKLVKLLKEFKWLIIFAICLQLFVTFVIPNVIVRFQVNGESMNDTLQHDDLMVGRKYIFDKPNYEDIIVFLAPSGDDYIKRVIGLPGDSITIENNVVYRNGEPLTENYIKKTDRKIDVKETFIPEGKYFVMGDNRGNSVDSRYDEVGLVDISQIDCKIYLRYKPKWEFMP